MIIIMIKTNCSATDMLLFYSFSLWFSSIAHLLLRFVQVFQVVQVVPLSLSCYFSHEPLRYSDIYRTTHENNTLKLSTACRF